jgi:acyl-CoA synthetase (AMP-forming)/AMP-acid ligase II
MFAVTFPFAHNAGYRAGWQISFLHGAAIIPVRSYEPFDMIRMIADNRVTIVPAPPPVWCAILDHPEREAYDLTSLRIISTGGTMLPVKLLQDLQNAFGRENISTGYGLTEAAGSVTNTRPGDSAEVIATTTGRPLPGLSVKLLDRAYREVPQGEAGEVAIKGDQILRGYYQDDAANAASFTADGYFLTGDIGVFTADGNLKITDRLKDMFIVGGFNCYPAEIEQVMLCHPAIASVAVVGVADDRLGQVGRAFVVRRPDVPASSEDIIAWCRNMMANYKVPRTVRFLDALPQTINGKVLKAQLREMA